MTRTSSLIGGLAVPLLFATIAVGADHDEAHKHATSGHAPQDPAEPSHPGDLKTIMVELGQDMNAVNAALWIEDWRALAAASQAIADHPHVSPTEKTRIATALGPDFAAFVKADHRVHDGAVTLAGAATAKDMSGVLPALSELQTGCIGCHDSFRERLKQQ